MGMLSTAVFVLSMNNFGPVADNAGGIVEMSGQPEAVRAITDRLDAVGNVTKATTKGYAVGGSALACFLLFRAYMDEIEVYTDVPFKVVDLAKVEVLVGGLLGVAMIFLFTGWAIAAVGVAAQEVVREVRRQFRDRVGIMEGTTRPDYDACVSIVTKSALKQMIKPSALVIGLPVITGLFFKVIGIWTEQPLIAVEVRPARPFPPLPSHRTRARDQAAEPGFKHSPAWPLSVTPEQTTGSNPRPVPSSRTGYQPRQHFADDC